MEKRKNMSQPTIVLVHGGFVDGSGWEAVYKLLKKDGYKVAIVQHPAELNTHSIQFLLLSPGSSSIDLRIVEEVNFLKSLNISDKV